MQPQVGHLVIPEFNPNCIEHVRSFLREQCLSPTPHYTEDIHENLKIFDRLFSEFEFAYVSCMVHVKTTKGL